MPIARRRLSNRIRVKNYGEYPDAGEYVYTVVDDCDIGLATRYNLYTIKGGYVACSISNRTVLLHRLILPDALEVDHRDRDKLHNRRANLRPSNRSANTHNTAPRGKSGYKGVFQASKGSWVAAININGLQTSLGSFRSPELAAMAYNRAALLHYGPTAYQNELPY